MKHYVRRSQVETTQTRAHAQVSGRIHNPPDLARHASQTERSSTEVVYHAGRATDALQLLFSRPASFSRTNDAGRPSPRTSHEVSGEETH